MQVSTAPWFDLAGVDRDRSRLPHQTDQPGLVVSLSAPDAGALRSIHRHSLTRTAADGVGGLEEFERAGRELRRQWHAALDLPQQRLEAQLTELAPGVLA